MKKFNSLDKRLLKGRGIFFAVVADKDYHRKDKELLGDDILIDEHIYTVIGMEFMKDINYKDRPMGLLVKEK